MNTPRKSKPQFNFWTLIIVCNLAAIVIGAAFQLENNLNPLSVLVRFGAFSCATAGGILLAISTLFSFSIHISNGASDNNALNLKKCWNMALIGFGLL